MDAPVISPLANDCCSGGNQFPAARAAPGCNGALNIPINDRTTSSASHTWPAAKIPNPIPPVNAQNSAEPSPMQASAKRGPRRSISQPPGIMNIV